MCLKWFGEADITTARKMGLEIMQEVASKYLNDKDDDALEQHRDDAIKARGKTPPEKPGFHRTKRVTSAEEDEASIADLLKPKGPQEGGQSGRAGGNHSGARPPRQASEDDKEHAAEGRGTQ